MSGFGNPLKEIPKAIFESLKRKVTRHEKCLRCSEKMHLDELEKSPWGQYTCKDEAKCLERRK